MKLNHASINFTVLLVLNILFLVSGVCLNSLVIISFWRNDQLRKKLCYFMIMLISCLDLVALFPNHSLTAYLSLYWLINGKMPVWELSPPAFLLPIILLGFPCIALLVMNFDRYLATYYPLFHRTSVTRRKLSIPLAVLSLCYAIVSVTSEYNIVISFQVFMAICCGIFLLPMTFFNYKLYMIARKSRRNKTKSPEMRRKFSLKKISNCLLSTACFTVLSIPIFVLIGLNMTSNLFEERLILHYWVRTIPSINGTCNCLIFYWKNNVLRTEGMKVIKGIKVCRRDHS